ncbi:MAG TPA: heme-binding beta-barrel domain-containing protein [Polyangia bacterium]|nr:heme-binding beta-barrel domain-containing protein [Polyangia bacterium]
MKRMFNGASGHRTVRSVLHSAVTLGAASALLAIGLMFVVSATQASATQASATQASSSSGVIAGLDYGPLVGLIGTWKSAPNGGVGVDVAPGQAGSTVGKGNPAVTPFYETITYTAAGGAVNASAQHLAALYYRQQVFAKSNNKKFHDQTGYLIYDKKDRKVYDTFCIPRGVCVVAEGAPGTTMTLRTKSKGVAETQFMLKTDRTQAFSVTFKLSGNTLKYKQKTDLQVYGKPFSHTDSDTLKKLKKKKTGG